MFRDNMDIGPKLVQRAVEWLDEEAHGQACTDLKGGKHTEPENAAAFSVLQFVLDCLAQRTLTVGHFLVGFPVGAFDLRDLPRSRIDRQGLLARMMDVVTAANIGSCRYVGLALKVNRVGNAV